MLALGARGGGVTVDELLGGGLKKVDFTESLFPDEVYHTLGKGTPYRLLRHANVGALFRHHFREGIVGCESKPTVSGGSGLNADRASTLALSEGRYPSRTMGYSPDSQQSGQQPRSLH